MYKICAENEVLLEKTILRHLEDGTSVLVARCVDGSLFVFDAMCTHADKSLENGKWNPENGYITCPFHKAIFDVKKEGMVVKAPACTPLMVYKTFVKEGDVYIEL